MAVEECGPIAVLASASYIPPEPGVSTDAFRKHYAVILAEAGDTPAAAALVSSVKLEIQQIDSSSGTLRPWSAECNELFANPYNGEILGRRLCRTLRNGSF